MTLSEYMRTHRLSDERMAGLLMDVRPESAPLVYGVMVGRWRRGVVGPSIEHAAAIFTATKGAVTPVDLWETVRAARSWRGS